VVSFAIPVLLLCWALQAQTPSPPPARVIAEELSVYEQASSSSRIIRTLKKGELVFVEIRLTASDGEWCGLRPETDREPQGWVLCSQIQEPPRPMPPTRFIPSEPEKPPPVANTPPRPAGPSTAPEAWIDALRFSEEQRARAKAWLDTSGVSGCRVALAARYRSMGIYDAESLLRHMPRTLSDRVQAAAIDRLMDSCIPRYEAFWKGFDRLMTAEQRKEALNNPRYVLMVASETDLMIFADVMRYMRGLSPSETHP
jgi:hypothetical protein